MIGHHLPLLILLVIEGNYCWISKERQFESQFDPSPPTQSNLHPLLEKERGITAENNINSGNNLHSPFERRTFEQISEHVPSGNRAIKRKRDFAFRPHSSPTGSSRYRYPIYKKRSSKVEAFGYDTNEPTSDLDFHSIASPNQLEENIISYLINTDQNRNLNKNSVALANRRDFNEEFEPLRSNLLNDKEYKSAKYLLNRFNKAMEQPTSSRSFTVDRSKRAVGSSTPMELDLLKLNESISSPSKEDELESEKLKVEDDGGRREKRSYMQRYFREMRNDRLARKYFSILSRLYRRKKRDVAGEDEEENVEDVLQKMFRNPSDIRRVNGLISAIERNIGIEMEEAMDRQKNQNAPTEMTDAIISEAKFRLNNLNEIRDLLSKLEFKLFGNEVYENAKNLATESLSQFPISEKRRKNPQYYELINSDRLIKKGDLSLLERIENKECAIFESIALNCDVITNSLNEIKSLFLEPCIKHEMCYLCRGEMGLSQRECDAMLSSDLETQCFNGDVGENEESVRVCLELANETLDQLEDERSFDSTGLCLFDPCVRTILQLR